MMEQRRNSLNEELKAREAAERDRRLTETDNGGETVLALDDTQRVKVLSPGRLVAKRFFRNKLAMVGLGILIFMFVFAFLCPLVYPYSQTQIFYKYGDLNVDYASASLRKDSTVYVADESQEIPTVVRNGLNSAINKMEAAGETSSVITAQDGARFLLDKLGENVYTLSTDADREVAVYGGTRVVASYQKLAKTFAWTGDALSAEFQTAVAETLAAGKLTFTLDDAKYTLAETAKNTYSVTQEIQGFDFQGAMPDEDFAALAAEHVARLSSFVYEDVTYYFEKNADGGTALYASGVPDTALVASTYVFDAYDLAWTASDAFKTNALLALYSGGRFEADGAQYTIGNDGERTVIRDAAGTPVAEMSTLVVRRYSGQDTLPIEFKDAARSVISDMVSNNTYSAKFTFALPKLDESAGIVYDENGKTVNADTEITVTRKSNQFVFNCHQLTYLIDIYSHPTAAHWFGTDGDGMDILARMMYGGRISLMVGFVVVLLETLLGVIMGGIAGFFGGWVDTLVMRLVDIFYCIPSYPILIIMGAFFDQIKMDPYQRLVWLMAILGILGWAGVARLVRGQILSLREQEFMVAEEATGMRAAKRIFRHLVPNVMPQLIVNATMGLGGVIITEATLSFLGLGVKHPLATWGTMINSVALSSESMIKYTYIWIPVGLLICLTVIAFNFVGDGLRDAFDPKAKQ